MSTLTASKFVDASGSRQRRSGWRIMAGLLGLVVPLLPVMVGAILLGTLGHLCAIFLTILAGYILLYWIFTVYGVEIGLSDFFVDSTVSGDLSNSNSGFLEWIASLYTNPSGWLWVLLVIAVLRGVLHYGEQYCNHIIAFKLLAIIRHRVFAKLRQLAPAKLEIKNQGDLLSVLTQDIELLEVFYAHTISPIVIAGLTCTVMVVFVAQFSWIAALLVMVAYLVIGVVIPLSFGRLGARAGLAYRQQVGDLNEFLLESLWGVDEVLQYGGGQSRAEQLNQQSQNLSQPMRVLNAVEARQRAVTNLAVLGFSLLLVFTQVWSYAHGEVSLPGLVLPVIALLGSFGPVIALANLSNSLHQTLACGERVLNILAEEPETKDIVSQEPWGRASGFGSKPFGYSSGSAAGSASEFGSRSEPAFVPALELARVGFAYPAQPASIVVDDFSLSFASGQVVGLYGPSGCGKSTVLKLLMRFWDPQSGQIQVFGRDVRQVNTSDLRDLQGYVTQETHLFQDTIANNIAVGKVGASRKEIERAARKASLHEFVESLPEGYDTVIGKNGVSLSGGEAQRVGVARAFLHDAPIMLLDEPTSNLDSLNEGMILKSLHEERGSKTVVLVSHRKSTLSFTDLQVDFTRLQ